MAITSIANVVTSDTFNDWLDTTNEVITSLSSVVTMGPGAVANNSNADGVTLTGPLITNDSTVGIKTDMITPVSGGKTEFSDAIVTNQQYLLTPAEGKNDMLQFVSGDDVSNTANFTWRAGPSNNHTSFVITGENQDGVSNDSIFKLVAANANTPGSITGTNIKLDIALLPDEITADTASSFDDNTVIQVGGLHANGAAVGGNVTGQFEFNGGETGPIVTALTVAGVAAGTVEQISIGNGLKTNATGNNITVTANLSHDDTGGATSTDNNETKPGYVVRNVEFDTLGHATTATSTNLDVRFIKRAPTSGSPTAADGNGRSLISDQGILFDQGTKASFRRFNDTTQASEATLSTVSTAMGSEFEIKGPSGSSDGVAIKAPLYLEVKDSSGSSKLTFYTSGNAAGSLIVDGDITAFGGSSDIALKENIEPIENALDKVNSIGGYTFNYIDAPEKGRVPGVIAQELQQVLPEAVYETEEGTLAVRYDNTIALLVEAIKELKERVDELEGK